MPAVAIVMPVFNRAGSVGQAMESILTQSFNDFEFLIVNDGSTDGSEAVIAAYTDPRIRYFVQPENKGGNAARNLGIHEAQSPIVCFIDSDDQFLRHKLDYVVSFFGQNSDVDVLIDSFEIVYPPETNRTKSSRINPVLNGSAEVERAIFARKIYKATPALSARRSALLDGGLFDETLKRRQDMDMILRLTKKARCATTDAILWTKYWSSESISAKQNTFMDAAIEICRRHPDYLTRPEFRIGLSRDLARHFLRLVAKRQFSVAIRDANRFAQLYDRSSLVKLIGQGLLEHLRRKTARQ